MAYLIGQIWLLIAAGVVVGFVLGWLLGEAARSGSVASALQADDSETAAVRAQLDELLEQDEQRAAQLHRLTDEKTSLENQLSMLGARLREAQAHNRDHNDGAEGEGEGKGEAEGEGDPDDLARDSTDLDASSASADA